MLCSRESFFGGPLSTREFCKAPNWQDLLKQEAESRSTGVAIGVLIIAVGSSASVQAPKTIFWHGAPQDGAGTARYPLQHPAVSKGPSAQLPDGFQSREASKMWVEGHLK